MKFTHARAIDTQQDATLLQIIGRTYPFDFQPKTAFTVGIHSNIIETFLSCLHNKTPMLEIRNIIAAYDAIDQQQEKVALASVVNVEESSYRRIGARMLVRSSGQWVGGISGGCLEGHALLKAQAAIHQNKPSIVTYDTMDDDANEIGVGLGCNGRIQVLFSPINPAESQNEIELLRHIAQLNQDSILLKIIEAEAGLQILGQTASLTLPYLIDEFVSIDAIQLKQAVDDTAERKKTKLVKCQTKDFGEVKLLVEYLPGEIQLIIVGDNYDIHALMDLALVLGWQITVVGLSKKLSKEVYKKAKLVISYDDIDTLAINHRTAVMLMSHDYKKDFNMLSHFIKESPAYLGLLGPKKRFNKMKHELASIDFDALSFIHSPTGLDIGAESPQEIALSVTAEIIATFKRKTGGSLRHKIGSIHDRE